MDRANPFKGYLNKAHRVSVASDGPVMCRACGGKMIRTGGYIDVPTRGPIQRTEGAGAVVLCGGCGWVWWLVEMAP